MKKITVILVALICMATTLLLTRCQKEINSGTSQLAVALKDAPGDYEHVRVHVRGIKIYVEHHGWITIPINDTIIDILQLQDTSALLGIVNIDAGTITQVQVLLGSDDTVTVGGIAYQLDLTDSTFIMKVNDTLMSHGSFTLTVDINSAQSIFDNGYGGHHHYGMQGSGTCYFRSEKWHGS